MLGRRVLAAVAAAVLAFPATAAAVPRDFFETAASGQAVYEDFVIRPQMLADGADGRLVVAYQGRAFDPYAAVYDPVSGTWRGPWRIADNPLVGDEHGGPAMIEDAQGFYHVFFGSHNSAILHARSVRPHDASRWSVLGPVMLGTADPSGTPVEARGTYPQPSVDASGTVRLLFRSNGGLFSDWVLVESRDACATWSAPEQVLDGAADAYGWYASSWAEPDGDLHVVATLLDYEAWRAQPFARQNLYYLRRDASTGSWTNAAGDAIAVPRDRAALESQCVAYRSDGRYVNQPVARVLPDGSPVLVFVSGDPDDLSACRWESVRWLPDEGAFSEPASIAETDHLFDAGTLLVRADGVLEAYLTTGGQPDEMATAWERAFAARGGDIVWYESRDGGASWTSQGVLRAAAGPWERFNNPQCLSLPDGRAAVLFCEGDNDYTASESKVFLWLDGAAAQRDMTPRGSRLAGSDRYETAVALSRAAFPSHAATVVVATGEGFADALCAAPLAVSLRAPLLLVRKDRLDAAVADEIRRLGAREAVVVGGEGAVSETVARAVGVALTRQRRVVRVAGSDRYATSVAIARYMAAVRGAPRGVLLATGENFPDALAGGVLSARKNMPVLLTRRTELPADAQPFLADVLPAEIIAVGDATVVSDDVVSAAASLSPGASTVRLGGPTRYDTAAAVVRESLARGVSLERFVVCTGEAFPDALAATVLAARRNSAVLFVRRYEVPAPTRSIIDDERHQVLGWDVVGGVGVVSTGVSGVVAKLVLAP